MLNYTAKTNFVLTNSVLCQQALALLKWLLGLQPLSILLALASMASVAASPSFLQPHAVIKLCGDGTNVPYYPTPYIQGDAT